MGPSHVRIERRRRRRHGRGIIVVRGGMRSSSQGEGAQPSVVHSIAGARDEACALRVHRTASIARREQEEDEELFSPTLALSAAPSHPPQGRCDASTAGCGALFEFRAARLLGV